jgi:hypothetical protein
MLQYKKGQNHLVILPVHVYIGALFFFFKDKVPKPHFIGQALTEAQLFIYNFKMTCTMCYNGKKKIVGINAFPAPLM